MTAPAAASAPPAARTRGTVRTVIAWLLALVLVAGAWAVTLLAPSDDAGADAFETRASIGERVEGRNIAATVLDVRLAETISSADGWSADGTWLVVELSAEAVVSQSTGYVRTATLQIGDRTYSASERGPDEMTLFATQLVTGIPRTGTLFFELPADAATGTGILRVAASSKPWGDTVIRLDIDLDAVERAPHIVIADTDWTNP